MMTPAQQSWTAYQVEPLQPLVFRSGRPFGTGATVDGANYPLPSAAAGLLRTLRAQQASDGRAVYEPSTVQEVEQIGPLLIGGAADPSGQAVSQQNLWIPRPADAVYMDDGSGGIVIRRLAPNPLPDGVGCDLPQGLRPVLMEEGSKGKPRVGPAWWTLQQWTQWRCDQTPAVDRQWQQKQPLIVRTTHVALDDRSRAAAEGQLFLLEAQDFGPRLGDPAAPGWAFVLLSNAEVADQLGNFGGEGRLSYVRREPRWLDLLRQPDASLMARARHARGVVLTLLTPAVFSGGWRPGWLDGDGCGQPPGCSGIQLALRAAAIDRWQPVSGWDLARGRPKAARRAVPAGAVYWFEVLQGEVEQVMQALWLAVISDAPEDRKQGFGAVLPAPWLA